MGRLAVRAECEMQMRTANGEERAGIAYTRRWTLAPPHSPIQLSCWKNWKSWKIGRDYVLDFPLSANTENKL